MNHSCDSNAHVYFNGRDLRCRALKDIAAGTEITVHYYPTPRHDVLLRRSSLDEYMYIECKCKFAQLASVFVSSKLSNPTLTPQATAARRRSPSTSPKRPDVGTTSEKSRTPS